MWYQHALIAAYLVVLGLLAIYGFHRTSLLWLYYRFRSQPPRPPRLLQDHELPRITVQLPLYNEMYVAERLLEAVARLDYPPGKLQIQVLDDSTDETQGICRRKVSELQRRGVDIMYIHRDDRTGFKAGALDNGLHRATGEYALIFDADFLPPPDMVRRMVHHFTDPAVAMVQTRWGHINRDYSRLTEVQALMLDGHHLICQTARHRSGLFFNFNGTAGMWRILAIQDAGGWQHDTITEDMDLSYRAQLRGWKFVYLTDTVTPAELPVEMNSFKAQQFRWAKGTIQVARKLLPTILRSNLPLRTKVEAVFHLTENFAYPLLLLLSLLVLPNLLVRTEQGWQEVLLVDLPLFLGTTTSLVFFYILSQREIRPESWRDVIKHLPLMLAVGIGLCINQTRAVLEALAGRESEFVRTPKHGVATRGERWIDKRYRAVKDLVPLAELAMAVYFAATVAAAVAGGHLLSAPFLVLFAVGFFYVGSLSLHQAR
jgi:cellulose synthase/poly-beta-1,6-N-acetylglucosamine synthase-like glycosyltransferase